MNKKTRADLEMMAINASFMYPELSVLIFAYLGAIELGAEKSLADHVQEWVSLQLAGMPQTEVLH